MDVKRALQIEKEVAKVFGFKRVAFSGAKWFDKEDIRDEGNGEDVGKYVIQVKATETTGIKILLSAINDLVKSGKKYHKTPVLVFHFDRNDTLYPTWCAVSIEEFLKMKKVYDAWRDENDNKN